MITADFVQTMARYNAWQNRSIYAAAGGLDHDARTMERGAFFGSIQRTLSHLLWGDAIWMSRLADASAPAGDLAKSPECIGVWNDLVAARREMDARILDWAGSIAKGDIDGTEAWYSGAVKRNVTQPRAVCIVHMFNHQTHHRGQVHAMLTAAGARPDDTDLIFMPDATG